MAKLLENKSEKLVSSLKTNKKLSFTSKSSNDIIYSISSALIAEKRIIDKNQRLSRIKASEITLTT